MRRNWTTINIRWERIEHEMCLVPNKINRFACQDAIRHSARRGPRGKKKLKAPKKHCRMEAFTKKLSWTAARKGFSSLAEIFRRSLLFNLTRAGLFGLLGDQCSTIVALVTRRTQMAKKILHGHDRTYLQQFSFLFASRSNACWQMIT